jgi:hypothetical protein
VRVSWSWIRRLGGSQRDRRSGADRRASHVLFSDWRWAVTGRRRVGRRREETAETGVDIYEPHLGLIALAIFLLSCLDAAFTLALIWGNLGVELNPFMRTLIERDAQLFVNLKIVFTGAGILFLVVLADARFLRRVRVRTLMYGVLLVYSMIVAYEIANLGLHIFTL